MHLYEEAIPYARREEEITATIPSARIPINVGLISEAIALSRGDLEGALEVIQEERKAVETGVFPSKAMRSNELYGALTMEALILGGDGEVNLGRPADATHVFERALALAEDAVRKDPDGATSRTQAARAGIALANILRYQDSRRALAVYDAALRRLGEIRTSLPAQRDRASALANSSYALRSLGRVFEARQRIDAALAILTDTKDYPAEQYFVDSAAFTVLCALADHESAAGDWRRAVQTYEQLLDSVTAAKPSPLNDLNAAPRLSRLYEALARFYRRTGDAAQAESMQARRVELWQNWDRKLPNNAFVRRQIEAASH
jgi:tetratricopeptide (TPR) repeat protein